MVFKKSFLAAIVLVFFLALPLASAALTDGNVLYWKLDSSGPTQSDATGNGNSGSVTGASWTSSGIVNGAYNFTGSSDVIQDTSPPIATSTSDSFSVGLLFSFDGTPGTAPVFFQGVDGTSNDVFSCLFAPPNTFSCLIRDSGGTAHSDSYTWSPDTGNHSVVLTFDNAANTMKGYLDGVERVTASSSDVKVISILKMGNDKNGGNPIEGLGDEFSVWDRSLTPTEVSDWNETVLGDKIQYPYITPSTNASITAKNVYDDSSINNFSINISGDLYHTTNGTVTTNILNNDTTLYDINFYNSTNFFNQTQNNYNFSASGDLEFETYQAIVKVSAQAKVSNDTLLAFGVTSGTYSNNTVLSNETTLFTDAGNLEFYLNGNSGWYSDAETKTITALTTNFIGLSNAYNYNLTITSKDSVSASSINNFSIDLLSNDYLGWVGESETTASGTIVFSLINGSYNANFTSSGYETINSNITVTSDTSYQFNASEAPSINITIKDSETLNLITQNINIDILSPTKFQTNTTSTGNIFLTSVTTGLNKITFNTANYSKAVYYVTLVSDESSILTAYLTNETNTEEITFVIKNTEAELVEEVTMTFTKLVGTESITVTNCLTDVSGSCKVNLDQSTTYNILIEADDYTTRTISLEPTETSYTITLSPLSEVSFVTMTEFFSYSLQPTPGVINTSIKNFNVTASSSDSLFQWFGLKTTYNGTDYLSNNTGSASGGSSNLEINLTAGTSLNINYFFKLSGYEVYEFNETYLVSNYTAIGNASLVAAAQDLENEGVSSFFLILLSVGLTLFTVVVVSPFVPPVALGFLSMLGIAVFTVIGWIPAFWGLTGLIVSVAMLILISRGGG